MKSGGMTLWNVFCEIFKTSWKMRKLRMKDDLEKHSKGQIPCGAMVEYHPIAKDQSRLHQFGEKVLPAIFFGYALIAGVIWKGEIMVADVG